jgi:hypothetical protein
LAVFLSVVVTIDKMASKRLLAKSLSRYNEIDAGDELRIPLKPFWIYSVMAVSNFYPVIIEND